MKKHVFLFDSKCTKSIETSKCFEYSNGQYEEDLVELPQELLLGIILTLSTIAEQLASLDIDKVGHNTKMKIISNESLNAL